MSKETPEHDKRPSLIDEARKSRSKNKSPGGGGEHRRKKAAPPKKAAKKGTKRAAPGKIFSESDIKDAKNARVILASQKAAKKRPGGVAADEIGLGGKPNPETQNRKNGAGKTPEKGSTAKKVAGKATDAVPGVKVAKKAGSALKKGAPGVGSALPMPGSSPGSLLGQARSARGGGKHGLHGLPSGSRKSNVLERNDKGDRDRLRSRGGVSSLMTGGRASGGRRKAGAVSSMGLSALESFQSGGDTKIEEKRPKKGGKLALLAAVFAGIMVFVMMAGVVGGGMSNQRDLTVAQGGIVALELEAQRNAEEEGMEEPPENTLEDAPRGRDSGSSRSTDSPQRLYPPDGGGDSGVLDLSERQLEAFSIAVEAARDEGLSEKSQIDVVLAVYVESKGWNLANDGSGAQGALKSDQDPEEIRSSMDHPESDGLPSDHGYGHGGDHGSVGIFQQQVPWWGSVDELMDRYTATLKFIEKYKEKNVADMPPGRAIQTVQASAYADGDNYQSNLPTAEAIYEAIK